MANQKLQFTQRLSIWLQPRPTKHLNLLGQELVLEPELQFLLSHLLQELEELGEEVAEQLQEVVFQLQEVAVQLLEVAEQQLEEQEQEELPEAAVLEVVLEEVPHVQDQELEVAPQAQELEEQEEVVGQEQRLLELVAWDSKMFKIINWVIVARF